MTFRITGLSPERFQPLFAMGDEALGAQLAQRCVADHKPGYPCRVSLMDAEPGEQVMLLNYESQTAQTPYRNVYAIYVREAAREAAVYTDELPPILRDRPIALRQFSADGFLLGASLGRNEDLTQQIKDAFARPEIAYLHAHNAMHGCFAARIDRAADVS